MVRKGGLGKGLDAIIPMSTEPTTGAGEPLYVSVNRIVPNPRQPRLSIDEDGEELNDLANSIREHGILQPLLVTQDGPGEDYVLVAGERRLRASKKIGLEKVPVFVRSTTDQERLELALIENVQRSDLSPIETARAYRQLIDEFGLKHEVIGVRVGKSRSAVTNTLRLLELFPEALQSLEKGVITEGHARAILHMPTLRLQQTLFKSIVDNDLSVRRAEELSKELQGERIPKPKKPQDPFASEHADIEDFFRREFESKVSMRFHPDGSGSLTIHFYNNEDLNKLLAHFKKD